ncbi:MAG: HAMP domain-containing histidine kinase, partial [Alphaproteobacteria bacterium]|nr:HAMP domain-containing histidine kinase [Alphaproteobacteria bacterium]
AGGAMSGRQTLALFLLATVCLLILVLDPAPPPWPAPGPHANRLVFRVSFVVALWLVGGFITGIASMVSGQHARFEVALRVTESVLAREQRLSALGALAAAAAHELGTPLATISVVAREMALEAKDGPIREDAQILVEQAQRCRDILKRLAERPDQTDVLVERLSLLDLVREVVAPYLSAVEVRVEGVVTGPPNVPAPDLWRRQEVLHALAALVENAYDFARSEILVTGRFDADFVSVEVMDDGPGFAPSVLARLGEPYLTSRPGAEGSRTGHVGMGLGFFISKTLLERTGAEVDFRNGARFGAVVTARWPRGRIEAR